MDGIDGTWMHPHTAIIAASPSRMAVQVHRRTDRVTTGRVDMASLYGRRGRGVGVEVGLEPVGWVGRDNACLPRKFVDMPVTDTTAFLETGNDGILVAFVNGLHCGSYAKTNNEKRGKSVFSFHFFPPSPAAAGIASSRAVVAAKSAERWSAASEGRAEGQGEREVMGDVPGEQD